MSGINCGICRMIESGGGNEDLIIFKTKYWGVAAASKQKFLGRCYAVTLRHCPSMSDITEEEWIEFGQVVKRYEKAVKKAFGAELFNWACHMNHAYRNEIPNPHIHWHIRPRYRNKVEFEGMVFDDDVFASSYHKCSDRKVSLSMMKKIAAEIRKNLDD